MNNTSFAKFRWHFFAYLGLFAVSLLQKGLEAETSFRREYIKITCIIKIKMLTEKIIINTKNYAYKAALIDENTTLTYENLWNLISKINKFFEKYISGSRKSLIVFASHKIDFVAILLSLLNFKNLIFLLDSKKMDDIQKIDKINSINFIIAPEKFLNKIQNSNIKINKIVKIDNSNYFLMILDNNSPVEIEVFFYEGSLLSLSSSGTKGKNKYVFLSEESILKNIVANGNSLGINSIHVSLQVLPLSYSYGLIGQLLTHLYFGATILLSKYIFSIENIKKSIEHHNVNNIFMVPSLFRYVLFESIASRSKKLLNNINFVTIGGDFIDSHSINIFIENFENVNVFKTYGLVEAGPRVSTLNVKENIEHIDSVGQPLEIIGAIEIKEPFKVENTDNRIIGDISIDSLSKMVGYLDLNFGFRKGKTEIQTGDVGFLNDSFIYLLGRKKEYFEIDNHLIFHYEILEYLHSYIQALAIKIDFEMKKINVYPGHSQINPQRIIFLLNKLHEKLEFSEIIISNSINLKNK